jgi:hypothetical protein
VQLDLVAAEALREALVDGWLACAPRPLADRYLGRLSEQAARSPFCPKYEIHLLIIQDGS